MKLNLLPPVPKLPAPANVTGYESPVGWWKVTADNEDGMRTEVIGEFFGHVAEIAFANAHRGSWQLDFHPIKGKPAPEVHPTYTASRNHVWIRFQSESGLDCGDENRRVTLVSNWLNVTDPKIVVKSSIPGCSLYRSVYLELVDPNEVPKAIRRGRI